MAETKIWTFFYGSGLNPVPAYLLQQIQPICFAPAELG
jgi:hypothetical protein